MNTSTVQQAPQASPPLISHSKQSKRFWIGMAVVLAIAILFRFTGYNFALPFIDQSDEPIYLTNALHMRGLYAQSEYPGYPPGILYLNIAAQVLYEQVAHQTALAGLPTVINILRIAATITSLFTILTVGLIARWFGGDIAGWLAALAWTFIPLVAQYAIVAIADPWLLLGTALAIYWALRGLDSQWRGWLLLSVAAGLVAVIFKYSALPVLVPGIAVAVWRMRENWRRWLGVLVLQGILIALVGLWLWVGYGAGRLTQVAGPAASFQASGLSRFLDIPSGSWYLEQSITELGLSLWVELALLVAGTILIASRKSLPKMLAWICLVGFSVFSAWLISAYNTKLSEARYGLTAEIGFVALSAAAIVLACGWLFDRIKTRVGSLPRIAGYSAILILAALWLAPLAESTWQQVQRQTLPDTRASVGLWSVSALGDGSIITDKGVQKAFIREWGGYNGPYRVSILDPVTSRPLADWLRDHVNYAEIPANIVQIMQQSDPGRAYLAQLLLLKQFPPSNPQGWRGPAFDVFRLGNMQVKTNVSFGGQIALTGYDRSAVQASPGDAMTLRFYWQAAVRPAANYSVFIHLTRLTDQTVLAQADGAPASAARPTVSWDDPGETLIGQPFTLQIPPDLPAGQYRVLIGLYDYNTGQRLIAASGDDSYPLLTLTVQSPDAASVIF